MSGMVKKDKSEVAAIDALAEAEGFGVEFAKD